MKLTPIFMTAAVVLTLSLSTPVLAGSPQADTDQGAHSDANAEAACPYRGGANTVVLSPEAPWISLALGYGEELGLSPEQTQALEEQRSAFQQFSEVRAEAIAEAERELSQALGQEPVDTAVVRARVDRIGALHSGLRQQRIEVLIQGRDVLDAEQRTKLQALAAEAHNAQMERHHGQAMPSRAMM